MGCLKLHIIEHKLLPDTTLSSPWKQNTKGLKNSLSLCSSFDKTCTGSYRYGFNGMEKDNEVKGNGNSLDFGARIYDPRLGRWLSVDPLMKKYPNESNYTFASNSPIVYVDPDGRDRIIYFAVKQKDGTTITVASKRKINNEVRLLSSRNLYGFATFYSTDVKITYTLDLSTNTWSESKVTPAYGSRHSFKYGLTKKYNAAAGKLDKMFGASSSNGKQPGGFVLTSAFASYLDGAKTDATKGADKMINIDLLLAAISAFGKSGTPPSISDDLSAADILDIGKDISTEVKDMINNKKQETMYKCGNGPDNCANPEKEYQASDTTEAKKEGHRNFVPVENKTNK